MKPALIRQPAGIGDVFYLQKMAHILRENGYSIIWPLRPDILWIKEYINDIEFCSIEDDFYAKELYLQTKDFAIEFDDLLFLSPDGIQFPGKRIMESKYHLIGQSDSDWYNYFNFDRKIDKENNLYYDVLGLEDDTEYIFVNKFSNTDVRKSNVIDNLQTNFKIVDLNIIDGYTLFDWCKVIENAVEIHTVHTSINYVIDKLDLKAKVYRMYQGFHSPEVEHIPFFKKPEFIPNK